MPRFFKEGCLFTWILPLTFGEFMTCLLFLKCPTFIYQLFVVQAQDLYQIVRSTYWSFHTPSAVNLISRTFGNAENRTWGCWVRSANATSVLCRPPLFSNFGQYQRQTGDRGSRSSRGSCLQSWTRLWGSWFPCRCFRIFPPGTGLRSSKRFPLVLKVSLPWKVLSEK